MLVLSTLQTVDRRCPKTQLMLGMTTVLTPDFFFPTPTTLPSHLPSITVFQPLNSPGARLQTTSSARAFRHGHRATDARGFISVFAFVVGCRASASVRHSSPGGGLFCTLAPQLTRGGESYARVGDSVNGQWQEGFCPPSRRHCSADGVVCRPRSEDT